jgi:hypothetical protein
MVIELPLMRRSPSVEAAKTVLKTISFENLIDGFPAWWRVFSAITRHPFHFATNLELEDPTALRPAFAYLLYSILVAFLLTAPVFLLHHTKANKILFPIRLSCQVAIFGVLIHYSLRLLGARRALSGSMTSYIYIGSTGMLLYLAIALPWLIGLGPDAIFGGLAEASQLKIPAALLVIAGLFGWVGLYVFLRWFEITHHIRKRRIFVALILSGIVGGALQVLLIAPFFRFLEKTIGGFLELF